MQSPVSKNASRKLTYFESPKFQWSRLKKSKGESCLFIPSIAPTKILGL